MEDLEYEVEICPRCKGTGLMFIFIKSEMIGCPKCNSDETIYPYDLHRPCLVCYSRRWIVKENGKKEKKVVACYMCKGSGHVDWVERIKGEITCKWCQGTGRGPHPQYCQKCFGHGKHYTKYYQTEK